VQSAGEAPSSVSWKIGLPRAAVERTAAAARRRSEVSRQAGVLMVSKTMV